MAICLPFATNVVLIIKTFNLKIILLLASATTVLLEDDAHCWSSPQNSTLYPPNPRDHAKYMTNIYKYQKLRHLHVIELFVLVSLFLHIRRFHITFVHFKRFLTCFTGLHRPLSPSTSCTILSIHRNTSMVSLQTIGNLSM